MTFTPSELRLRSIPWHALPSIEAALEPALTRILHGAPAERVLDRLLRDHRDFTSDQRTVAAETLFGVGLWRRRLRFHRPHATPLELARLLAFELLDLEPPPDWRDRFSIPDWIAEHAERRFGADHCPAWADGINQPGPITLRARDDRTVLADHLRAHGIDTIPGTLARQSLHVVTPRPNLYGLPPHFLGTFEVQDEGSQLISEIVDPRPGQDVLDLCAGAGGKSLHLAALGAKVHACDVDLSKLERLRIRARHARAEIIVHGAEPPQNLRVPLIVVDGPCSELGVLQRGPDTRWRIDPHCVATWARVNRELLERAFTHLLPGGRVVFATCTFTFEENERVVEALTDTRSTKELELPGFLVFSLEKRLSPGTTL